MKCVYCIKFYNGIVLKISACTIMPGFRISGHVLSNIFVLQNSSIVIYLMYYWICDCVGNLEMCCASACFFDDPSVLAMFCGIKSSQFDENG